MNLLKKYKLNSKNHSFYQEIKCIKYFKLY